MQIRRNPARRPTWVALAVALAAGWAVGGDEATVTRPATIFVLRHAEKMSEAERDPGLSPTGARRAEALATLLAHAGVTHLVATEFRRTQETLRPLAERVGLELEVRDAARVDDLARWLAALPAGAVAVVAGHSNTVPAIVHGLGGRIETPAGAGDAAVLDDDDYGKLFLVIRPGAQHGSVQTLELRYGP